MILTGDWTIQAGLRAQWAAWQADADALMPEIFRELDATQQAAIRRAWGPGTAPVPIHLAAPLTTPPAIPSIWIDGGGGGEQVAGDVIGQAWGEAPDGSPIYGVWVRQTWRIVAYGVDVTSTLALSALVRWALYRQRVAWGAEPPAFVDQQVSWQAWEPVPDDLLRDGIFPFTRPILFSAAHADTWQTAPPPVITAIQPPTLT